MSQLQPAPTLLLNETLICHARTDNRVGKKSPENEWLRLSPTCSKPEWTRRLAASGAFKEQVAWIYEVELIRFSKILKHEQ